MRYLLKMAPQGLYRRNLEEDIFFDDHSNVAPIQHFAGGRGYRPFCSPTYERCCI